MSRVACLLNSGGAGGGGSPGIPGSGGGDGSRGGGELDFSLEHKISYRKKEKEIDWG